MTTFNNIDAWAKSLESRMEKVVKETIVDVGEGVMSDTPIKTSSLVSNYKTSINNPDLSTNPNLKDGGNSAFSDLTTTVNGMDISDSLYFTNSLVYAWKAEYGGWQFTEPYGMVRINVDNWGNVFNRNFKKYFK